MKSKTFRSLELMGALRDRRDWRDEAKCLGVEPWRYETANLSMFSADLDAKRLCAGCPVQAECLADAEKSFRMADFTGVAEWDAELWTTGVVRGGRVFA